MTDWPDFLGFVLGSGTIPIWLKVAYAIFVCVLVPIYRRHHGLANFLWFSDIALFVTLVALWLESSLLASMQTVSVVLLELIWTVDFLARLIFRVEVTAITKYMFKREIPLLVAASRYSTYGCHRCCCGWCTGSATIGGHGLLRLCWR
jgi:hypothetical protein